MRGRFLVAAALVLGQSAPSSAQLPASRGPALPGDFVYLRDVDPGILQDIRYATANNFTGRKLAGYDAGRMRRQARGRGRAQPRAAGSQAARPVAENAGLLPPGAGFARDACLVAGRGRDDRFAEALLSELEQARAVRARAISRPHSGHSTGAAVDVTLVDLSADKRRRIRSGRKLCRLHRDCGQARARGQRRHGLRVTTASTASRTPARHRSRRSSASGGKRSSQRWPDRASPTISGNGGTSRCRALAEGRLIFRFPDRMARNSNAVGEACLARLSTSNLHKQTRRF